MANHKLLSKEEYGEFSDWPSFASYYGFYGDDWIDIMFLIEAEDEDEEYAKYVSWYGRNFSPLGEALE